MKLQNVQLLMVVDVDDYVISYINELLSLGETMFSPFDSLVYQVSFPSLLLFY